MSQRQGVSLRRASVNDVDMLSTLAFLSKAYWGYSKEFMAACREELSVTPEKLARYDYVVACCDDNILGFYAIDHTGTSTCDLEALFVHPDSIGQGIGTLLLNHAIQQAVRSGADYMILQSDPNAAAFYAHAGAELIGQRESDSITGRYLPVYSIKLCKEQN